MRKVFDRQTYVRAIGEKEWHRSLPRKMKRTKKALKQSLSLTLRTVPKPVNRQIILTRNHRKLQKRPMTSLNLS